MRQNRLLILGGFLVGTMIATGCGSSTSSTDGAAGKGGAGGSGSGGSGMDAGLDHGGLPDVGTDTTSGAGGKLDAGLDMAADHATGAGGSDAASDTAANDAPMDKAVDTAPQDAGPCVTNYGAGNPVQFAFDGGANGGWNAFVTHGAANLFPISLAASFTEGRSCPGSLLLGLNPTAYGQSGAIEFFYGVSPAGRNWTGYKALHAWIKAESADLTALNGVYFYMKSGNQVYYQSDFAAGASLSDWHEVVIDLTRAPNIGNGSGVMITDVQQIGFEAALNTGPGVGAPAAPRQVLLLADDIWLEAAPAPDGGAGDGGGQ